MLTRAIPGLPGYQASSCGNIISHRKFTPHVLSPCKHPQGYRKVLLRVGDGYKNFLVHRLVMLAWVGPCPKGCVTNHKNGDKADNRLENLEYCTQSENMAHACRLGLTPKPPTRRGENAPKAKLTAQDVHEIRSSKDTGRGRVKLLAEKYGVTTATMSKVLLGQTWKHLPLCSPSRPAP